MSNRSEPFARLLKGAIGSIAAYEGKTNPAIEDDLGEQIGVSGATIQRWKSGILPNNDRAIEILAEAAVRRGFLGREWLQRFLHAARYSFADKLLNQLCPIGPVRPRPPRIYENLPAPTYSQFVMRQVAFSEVIDGLQQRSAVVLIVGLGGNGKTSLAHEVAARCLQEDSEIPRFDAVVWVSDKDHPGTTNLSIVLDEIARTLDYPGFTQFAHDEKLYEVGQLLKRQRVLVVVDNFETITDGALLAWLLRLPEPSKAMITSREYGREYRRGGWPVELRGMCEDEAREFVSQRLRFLKIEMLVSSSNQLEPLLVATSSNPKAIEIALGLVKHESRPLQHVVDDLYAARGDLFGDLFARAWALLDEAARRVLLVMTFFPSSANAEALRATADVQKFAFDRVVEQLTDLALLDVQKEDINSMPRYALHPLVRAFARVRLMEQQAIEADARERWVTWYMQLIQAANTQWYIVTILAQLDNEKENIGAVVSWADKHQRYMETMATAGFLGYYYYVRGLWEKSRELSRLRLSYARRVGDRLAEVRTARAVLGILILQGELDEAENYLSIITDAIEQIPIDLRTRCAFLHVIAMYAQQTGKIDRAQQLLKEIIEIAKDVDQFALNKSRNWLAHSLFHQGNTLEAKALFETSLAASLSLKYERSITFCEVNLARIALDEAHFAEAQQLLESSKQRVSSYNDRRDMALVERIYGRYYQVIGNKSAAIAAYSLATDLYERLGIRRELAESRAELTRLDDSTTTTS